MRRPFSQRSQAIPAFKAMAILAKANEMALNGRDIIHLEVGQPDFPVAEAIRTAGIDAIRAGQTGYSDANGLPALRAKISDHYQSVYGLNIAERRIILTAGASGALALVVALLTDPGDGWLLTDPGYPSNRRFIEAFSGIAQTLAVGPNERFQLSASLVAKAWQSNTVSLLLGSPANPTGTSLSRIELQALAGVVEEKNGFLVSDEIYQGLEYGPVKRVSALSVTNDAFVINSFSKYFGMTGWRLGWVVAPDGAEAPLIRLAQNLTICPSVPAQYAALAAFEPSVLTQLEEQRETLAERRGLMLANISETGLQVPVPPDGAFYLYAKLPERFGNADDYCQALLEQEGVAITPGTDFGDHDANHYVRISYAQPRHILQKALERMVRFRT
ncbi:MAG: aminotransferase class I/II-fold pyridoxal phosphate-dependent enzyme [Pseudomonadales bacterium]